MILNNYPNFHTYDFSYEWFEMALKYYCNWHMKIANNEKPYVIDQYNTAIIQNMYYWLQRDERCQWSYNKGLYLCGTIGCGKTILMKGFLEVVKFVSGYYIPFFHSATLYNQIVKFGIESMKKNPIYIDELGREQLEVYINGARVRPIEDLMAIRYEYGACTFFTTNFKLETLSRGFDDKGKKVGYGQYIGDRIKEMCNIIVMPGPDRRNV